MSAATALARSGPGWLPSQNSKETDTRAGERHHLCFPRDRTVLTPVAQGRPEARMIEQPAFETERGSGETGRSQDQERRGRQHRQKGSNETERYEQQPGREIDAAQGRRAMQVGLAGHDRFTA